MGALEELRATVAQASTGEILDMMTEAPGRDVPRTVAAMAVSVMAAAVCERLDLDAEAMASRVTSVGELVESLRDAERALRSPWGDAREVRHDTKECAQILRKRLRAAFPGVKFSVRMARGTAYGWLHVDWTDGPVNGKTVRDICRSVEGERWDGMSECYQQVGPTMTLGEDGGPVLEVWACTGVNTQREISDAAVAEAAPLVPEIPGVDWTSNELRAWPELAGRQLLGVWIDDYMLANSTPRDLLRRALHELDLTAGVAAGISAVAR